MSHDPQEQAPEPAIPTSMPVISRKGCYYAGVKLPDLAEGELAMDAIVLVKVLDAGGVVRYREYKSNSLHAVEALGMVATMEDTLRAGIMGGAGGR